jgi:hypothetical protein
MKGINKFSPKLGKILKQGQSMGLDVAEGLEFVKNKMNEPEKKRQEALKKFNERKKKGKGVVADLEERFQQQYGQPQWKTAEGQATTQPADPRAAPQQTPHGQQPFQPQQMQQPQQSQQGESLQGQPNNTDAALLAAFQKILQM